MSVCHMSVHFMLTFEDLCLRTRPVWWGNRGKTPRAVTGWRGSGELWPRPSHLRLDRLSSCLWHRAESLMTTLRGSAPLLIQCSFSAHLWGDMMCIWTSRIITDSCLCLALFDDCMHIDCILLCFFLFFDLSVKRLWVWEKHFTNKMRY